MKAARAVAVTSGFWGEFFARTKQPKSLAHYLEPEPTAAEKRAIGAAKVRALFERNLAKAGSKETDDGPG